MRPPRRMRATILHGELYLCRADLLTVIQDMAELMPDPDDRTVAVNLVEWLRQQTGTSVA